MAASNTNTGGTHGNAGKNPGHSGGNKPGNSRPGNGGTGGGKSDGGKGGKR